VRKKGSEKRVVFVKIAILSGKVRGFHD